MGDQSHAGGSRVCSAGRAMLPDPGAERRRRGGGHGRAL
jgi:hypothetical protein